MYVSRKICVLITKTDYSFVSLNLLKFLVWPILNPRPGRHMPFFFFTNTFIEDIAKQGNSEFSNKYNVCPIVKGTNLLPQTAFLVFRLFDHSNFNCKQKWLAMQA